MLARVMDFSLASILILLFSPLFLIISLLIYIEDGSPILFSQERLGQGGKTFRILKFRTMKKNTAGPLITAANDTRVTRVGKVLRRWRLDELPQLINVLKGEMSLVGPRPEVPEFAWAYKGPYQEVLSVKPGITGPTQLAFKNEEEMLAHARNVEEFYSNRILPQKLQMDLQYVYRKSVWYDLKILLHTLAALVRTK